MVTQGGHSALAECSVSRTEIHLSKSSVGLAVCAGLIGELYCWGGRRLAAANERSGGAVTGMASSGDLMQAAFNRVVCVGDLGGEQDVRPCSALLQVCRSGCQALFSRAAGVPVHALFLAWVGRSGNRVQASLAGLPSGGLAVWPGGIPCGLPRVGRARLLRFPFLRF